MGPTRVLPSMGFTCLESTIDFDRKLGGLRHRNQAFDCDPAPA